MWSSNGQEVMQPATAIWRNHKVSHAIEGESEGLRMAGRQGWDCKSWFEFEVGEIWAPVSSTEEKMNGHSSSR